MATATTAQKERSRQNAPRTQNKKKKKGENLFFSAVFDDTRCHARRSLARRCYLSMRLTSKNKNGVHRKLQSVKKRKPAVAAQKSEARENDGLGRERRFAAAVCASRSHCLFSHSLYLQQSIAAALFDRSTLQTPLGLLLHFSLLAARCSLLAPRMHPHCVHVHLCPVCDRLCSAREATQRLRFE